MTCFIQLWDPRKKGEIRAYTQHFDFISDFLWLEDKKQLVATRYDIYPVFGYLDKRNVVSES
jgi:hypothetical protein